MQDRNLIDKYGNEDAEVIWDIFMNGNVEDFIKDGMGEIAGNGLLYTVLENKVEEKIYEGEIFKLLNISKCEKVFLKNRIMDYVGSKLC